MFLSFVIVVRNLTSLGSTSIDKVAKVLNQYGGNYELIIVDNGSSDSTVRDLKESLESDELPNSILFSLSRPAETDAALWLGIDHSIGDYVITIPGDEANLSVIPLFLDEIRKGNDYSVAINKHAVSGTVPFRLLRWVLGRSGASSRAGLSRTTLLSRNLVTFLSDHSRPHLAFRRLSQTPGLEINQITFHEAPITPERKSLRRRFESGVQFLLWRNPLVLRASSFLALFGAIASLSYSLYVLAVFLSDTPTEAGWASTSLQISGMFFLTSLVLVVMSEILLLVLSVASQDPVAFPADEFSSRNFGPLSKLNVLGNLPGTENETDRKQA